jgi:hypothetical protein
MSRSASMHRRSVSSGARANALGNTPTILRLQRDGGVVNSGTSET